MVLDGSARGELRDAIVKASLQLGSELGEEGLTMRAIAGRLGVSPTALYQHFEGKTAILQEIRTRGIADLFDSMVGQVVDGDLRTSLVGASRAFVEFAINNPWLYRVLHADSNLVLSVVTEDQRAFLSERMLNFRRPLAQMAPGATSEQMSELLAHWWASNHGLASLIIARRFTEEHPIAAIRDVDGFAADYIERTVDCLVRRVS